MRGSRRPAASCRRVRSRAGSRARAPRSGDGAQRQRGRPPVTQGDRRRGGSRRSARAPGSPPRPERASCSTWETATRADLHEHRGLARRSAPTRPAAARPTGPCRSAVRGGRRPRCRAGGLPGRRRPGRPRPAPTRGLNDGAWPNARGDPVGQRVLDGVRGPGRHHGQVVGERRQVGLVDVPGEDLGPVGAAAWSPRSGRDQATNSSCALDVVPGGPHRHQVGGGPVDLRVVPDRPARLRCRGAARAASSAAAPGSPSGQLDEVASSTVDRPDEARGRRPGHACRSRPRSPVIGGDRLTHDREDTAMTRYIVLLPGDEAAWEATPRGAEGRDVRQARRVRAAPRRARAQGHRRRRADPVPRGRAWSAASPTGSPSPTGPYAETAEQLTGFYVVETDDLDDLVEVVGVLAGARERHRGPARAGGAMAHVKVPGADGRGRPRGWDRRDRGGAAAVMDAHTPFDKAVAERGDDGRRRGARRPSGAGRCGTSTGAGRSPRARTPRPSSSSAASTWSRPTRPTRSWTCAGCCRRRTPSRCGR